MSQVSPRRILKFELQHKLFYLFNEFIFSLCHHLPSSLSLSLSCILHLSFLVSPNSLFCFFLSFSHSLSFSSLSPSPSLFNLLCSEWLLDKPVTSARNVQRFTFKTGAGFLPWKIESDAKKFRHENISSDLFFRKHFHSVNGHGTNGHLRNPDAWNLGSNPAKGLRRFFKLTPRSNRFT